MSKSKRYIWLGLFAVIMGLAAWIYMRGSREKAPEWKTVKIEKGNIAVNVTATGSLSALTTVDVGTQVSGIIAKLFADYNSEVKKGQVIALLDTSVLATTYSEASALFDKSLVQMKELKVEYDREKKLFEENAVSKSEYDQADANYRASVSALQASEAGMNRAKINRQYAIIRAPIKGVVISRNVDVGQTVVSAFNSPVLYVIANDLKKMQVYANVDEADIGQVRPDQEVVFTVDAYPGVNFSGKVNQIRLQPVVVQNVVTYIVVIDVDNPDLKLLPGLTANINFKILEHQNVFKVQSAALQFMPSEEFLSKSAYPVSLINEVKKHQGRNKLSGDTAYVWVMRNNEILPEQVKIGIIANGFAEISGNIHEGENLIVRTKNDESASTARSPFLPSFKPKRM